jgi:excinuclease ABC subunit A
LASFGERLSPVYWFDRRCVLNHLLLVQETWFVWTSVRQFAKLVRNKGIYVLDEPTTGLHAADVDKLMVQLDALVASGNTVIVVEHDMRVVAGSDWVMDIGPNAGDEGGRVVASGTPTEIAATSASRTATYLLPFLA